MRTKKHFLAFAIIILICGVFFANLFFPHPKIFITPEYNGSDTTNFNIPVRLLYSQALKEGTFPLWESKIGLGFPLLAESQIGAFYLPNYLTYKYLPFIYAFNLGYVLAFIIGFSGTYAYLQHRKFSWKTSMLSGGIFVGSSFFLAHLNHYNMVQAASLFPWLLLIFSKVTNADTWKRKTMWLLIFGLVLSQQLFAGYGQITFITLCAIACSAFLRSYTPLLQSFSKKKFLLQTRELVVFALLLVGGIVLAVLLSAVQLLPMKEVLAKVARPENYNVIVATHFSYPFKALLTFINPFYFGSPQLGTFPPPEQFDGNFFWEVVSYIGILPLFIGIGYAWVKRRDKHVLFWVTFAMIFFVLMLGKFSPAYFIYSIPPFNIFRVPSRFMLPVMFALVMLFAFALDEIQKHTSKKYSMNIAHIVFTVIVLLCAADVFYHWHSYYPKVDAAAWLEDPVFAKKIKEQQVDGHMKGRLMNIDSGQLRAKIYGEEGWKNNEDFYVNSRNEMLPNMSSTWGIPQLQAYTGISHLKRHNVFEGALEFSIDNRAKTKPEVLLNILNVAYLTNNNPKLVPFEGFKQIATVPTSKGNPNFYLYENPNVLPRARVVYSYLNDSTLNGIVQGLITADETLQHTALLEEEVPFSQKEHSDEELTNLQSKTNIKWLKDTNLSIVLKVDMPEDGILILADMYEDNWRVYVDDKPSRIYPAYLVQRAVIVPQGEHIVRFNYEAKSYENGKRISIISHATILLVLCYFALQTSKASLSKKKS